MVVLYLGDALNGVPDALQAATAPPPPPQPAGSDDEDEFEEVEEVDEEGWEDVQLADEAAAASVAPPWAPRFRSARSSTIALRAVGKKQRSAACVVL